MVTLRLLRDAFISAEEVHVSEMDNLYPVWDYLRFKAFRDLTVSSGLFGQDHVPFRYDARGLMSRLIRSIPNMVQRNPMHISKNKEVLMLGHPRRQLNDDGEYVDPYTNPFLPLIGEPKIALLEGYYQEGHMVPTAEPVPYYLDYMSMITLLSMKRPTRLTLRERETLRSISQHIFNYTSVEIDFIKHYKDAKRKRQVQLPYYHRLLTKVNPKLVFIIVHYGNEALIEAAQNLNKPTIELQHGTISSYHLGYHSSVACPKKLFPDKLLTFGDFWANDWYPPGGSQRLESVGFPQTDRYRKIASESKKKDQLLIISQGPIGRELSVLAVKIQPILEAKGINIIYKLHPGEFGRWRDEYPKLADSEIQVIEGAEPNLEELFNESSWVLGVYSTALFECLFFNCQIIVADLPGWEHMESLINSGTASLIHSPQDIISALEKKNQINVDYFFAKEWRANFQKSAARLL